MTRFALSPTMRIAATRMGAEGEPVLLIDRFLVDPHALVDAAAASAFAPAYGAGGGYPGMRASAPLDYVEDAVRALVRPIADTFGLGVVRPRHAECSFSMVTLPADRLMPSQRAPHIDTADPRQFAILHYLCGPAFGGTAFFRHRATGYEAITAARLAPYEAVRAGEATGAGYVENGDAAFERIGAVEAVFDRLVVYRSRLLHSGLVGDPAALSADPRRGRLTANIFLTLA